MPRKEYKRKRQDEPSNRRLSMDKNEFLTRVNRALSKKNMKSKKAHENALSKQETNPDLEVWEVVCGKTPVDEFLQKKMKDVDVEPQPKKIREPILSMPTFEDDGVICDQTCSRGLQNSGIEQLSYPAEDLTMAVPLQEFEVVDVVNVLHIPETDFANYVEQVTSNNSVEPLTELVDVKPTDNLVGNLFLEEIDNREIQELSNFICNNKDTLLPNLKQIEGMQELLFDIKNCPAKGNN